MVIFKSISGCREYRINDELKRNLDILLHGVKEFNQDAVIVMDGDEGSGKSQSVRQLALYCAEQMGSKFDREGTSNIFTNMEDYKNAFEKAAIDGVVGFVGILDESRAVLGKAASQSREVKHFTNWLSECRNIRGIHFILLPAFHDLAKYVVLWRMRLLIHMKIEYSENPNVMGGYKLKLGGYQVYPNDAMLKFMYTNPYNYPKQWAIQDRFDNVEVLTPKGLAALEEQKRKDREERSRLASEAGPDRSTIMLNGLLAVLVRQGHRAANLARIFGITRQSMNQRLRAGEETVIYTDWVNKQGVLDEEKDE